MSDKADTDVHRGDACLAYSKLLKLLCKECCDKTQVC